MLFYFTLWRWSILAQMLLWKMSTAQLDQITKQVGILHLPWRRKGMSGTYVYCYGGYNGRIDLSWMCEWILKASVWSENGWIDSHNLTLVYTYKSYIPNHTIGRIRDLTGPGRHIINYGWLPRFDQEPEEADSRETLILSFSQKNKKDMTM